MNSNDTRDRANDYWSRHSLKWEAGAYYRDADLPTKKGILETLASIVRGDSVYRRMQVASGFLQPHLANSHVLDIGCGSGRFCKMLADLGAAKVTGIDICASSIEYAKSRYPEDNFAFEVLDVCVPGTALPPCDVVTALGVVEYLNTDQLRCLIQNLSTDKILFHCIERPKSLRRKVRHAIRQPYLWLKGVPPIHFHDLEDISQLSDGKGIEGLRYVFGNNFVTNLD